MDLTNTETKVTAIYLYDDFPLLAEGWEALINHHVQQATCRYFSEEAKLLDHLKRYLPGLLYVHCSNLATMNMIIAIRGLYPSLPILAGMRAEDFPKFSELKEIDKVGYYCMQSPTPVFLEAIAAMKDKQVFVDPALKEALAANTYNL